MNTFIMHIFSGSMSIILYLAVLFLIFGKFDFVTSNHVVLDRRSDVTADSNPSQSIELTSILQQVPPDEDGVPSDSPPRSTPSKKVSLNDMFSNIPVVVDKDSSKESEEEKAAREELRRQKELQKEAEAKRLEQIKRLSQNAHELQQNLEELKNVTQHASDVVSNLNEVQIDKPLQNHSDNQADYNDWYAEVARIMSGWKNEGNYYRDANIIVRVSVDSDGTFRFMYVFKSSGFGDYDNIAVSFLKRLESVVFPIPPGNDRQELNLSFTSKVNKLGD